MKTELIFLGTKGEIEEEARGHKYHSSLLIIHDKTKILIDYGTGQKNLDKINPDAIFITHAHPDHYIWTMEKHKTKIPIYLTKETYNYGRFKPEKIHFIKPNNKYRLSKIDIIPYNVLHSIRCPAVGYKVKIGKLTLIYNPDLVDIVKKDKILKGIDYYIGDGSAVRANLVRRKGNTFFGHTRITTQINWCKKFAIKNIIFTHLGKETLRKEKEFSKANPGIIFAHDGMKISIQS